MGIREKTSLHPFQRMGFSLQDHLPTDVLNTNTQLDPLTSHTAQINNQLQIVVNYKQLKDIFSYCIQNNYLCNNIQPTDAAISMDDR